MSAALPPGIQHKLELTLAQWASWQCDPPLRGRPEVREVLTPGISNYSVLVASDRLHVVRIDGVNPVTNGLNRQSEWRTLVQAHRAGLAPQPQYCNPELGSLVCEFLEQDSDTGATIDDVGLLLRAIHALPPRHQRLDLAERIQRYERHLHHAGGERLRRCGEAVRPLLSATATSREMPLVLCHNDLLRANRLYHGGRLKAIDWEYSAMASPWYDLAVVINGDALDPNEARALVRSYLQREPEEDELMALHRYGCIYRYLELLWYLALEQPVLGEEEVAARESALAKMLSVHS